MSEGKKIYDYLLYAECKIENNHLICQAGKFDVEEYKIKRIPIKVKSIYNHGCSGVDVSIDGNSIILKRRYEPLEKLKKMDVEDIWELWEPMDLFEMEIENGVAKVFANEPYPCE